jgi:hypothetical protein
MVAMNNTISQKQVDQLLQDAAYIQEEAEALKYVIEQVPYQEAPPGQRSIAEILFFIDYAQLHYFRFFLEEAIKNPRPTRIDKFSDFEETFDIEEIETENIQKILNKLAKHRAGVINIIKNISLSGWSTIIHVDNREILLFDFIQQMIRFDHIQLNKIAELVRSFNEQKQNERRIWQQQSMQKSPSNNSTD